MMKILSKFFLHDDRAAGSGTALPPKACNIAKHFETSLRSLPADRALNRPNEQAVPRYKWST
jgi:hypothetical protein